MEMRQIVRIALYVTGLAAAAGLAMVFSGRYGSVAYAVAGLAALVWTLAYAAACRAIGRPAGAAACKADETAVIWSA
jgi:hypothetical protein